MLDIEKTIWYSMTVGLRKLSLHRPLYGK